MIDAQWRELKARVASQFRLDKKLSAHTVDHWERVTRYGMLLCELTGADVTVVRLFALLHDSRREKEGLDPEHGPRAAQYASELCGEVFELEPERLEQLMIACEEHDRGITSSDPTVGTCWDADRLDLDRAGIVTSSLYMSTKYGRKLSEMLPAVRHKLAGIAEGDLDER